MNNLAAISPEKFQQIHRPIHVAAGLPNHAYTSTAFFELERERVFSQRWTCIGQACRVPSPGDALPTTLMGLPLVIVRNSNGEIKVFHNVCSHRGNELVWQPCSDRKVLTCPYHAWSYDLNGQLVGTPHIGGHGHHSAASFDKTHNGLREVRTAVWMDLIFVNLAENQPDFTTYIAPLQRRLETLTPQTELARLRPAADSGTLQLHLNSNWKLCIENNLESYHLPWVHPDLNAISKLEDHYHFYGDDLFAGQGSKAYIPNQGDHPSPPAFAQWRGEAAEYPTLFPNVFLGMQRDHCWTMVIEPVAPNVTREHLQIYYIGDGADAPEMSTTRAHKLTTWTTVFSEDVGVVEGMHRGRHSPAFEGGVFSPVMDDPTHHFHKWVADELAR